MTKFQLFWFLLGIGKDSADPEYTRRVEKMELKQSSSEHQQPDIDEQMLAEPDDFDFDDADFDMFEL